MNDRDRAQLDELDTDADGHKGGVNGDGTPSTGKQSSLPSVEVSNVTVGSMVRLATVDKCVQDLIIQCLWT